MGKRLSDGTVVKPFKDGYMITKRYGETMTLSKDQFSEIRKAVKEIEGGEMTTITIDLPDDLVAILAMKAHQQGITLNDYVVSVLIRMAESEDASS